MGTATDGRRRGSVITNSACFDSEIFTKLRGRVLDFIDDDARSATYALVDAGMAAGHAAGHADRAALAAIEEAR